MIQSKQYASFLIHQEYEGDLVGFQRNQEV